MGTLQSQIRWSARGQWTLLSLMLTVVVTFYVFGYRPLTRRLAELRGQIVQREGELTAGRAETRVLPDVAGEVRRLRDRLERSHKSIPPQQELPEFIRNVTQLSQQGNLKKFMLTPGAATRRDQLCELPIKLNFEGDFTNVFSFLRNAEEMPRLIRVRGMIIKARDKDKSGQVQVTLSMNIYFSAE